MTAIVGVSFGATSSRISITPTLSSSSLFPPLTLVCNVLISMDFCISSECIELTQILSCIFCSISQVIKRKVSCAVPCKSLPLLLVICETECLVGGTIENRGNLHSCYLIVATEKKEKEDSTVEVPAKKPKPAAAKASVAKPLREMMEEDVIPPLKAILEAQDDISEIDLSFQDDKVS